MTTFFLSESLRSLTKGSFEDLISRLGEKVKESAPKLFGEAVETRVLATFPGHAIVAGSNGQVRRLRFDEADNGDLLILQNEQIDAPLYTPEHREDFVRENAAALVRDLLEGRAESANHHFAELLAAPGTVADSSSELSEADDEDFFASPWRTVFDLHSADITRACWDSGLKDLEDRRLSPKFEDLQESSGDSHRALVLESLGLVAERLIAGRFELAECQERLPDEKVALLEGANIREFGAGLLDSFSKAEKLVQRALTLSEEGAATHSLARVHDAVAKNLFPMEVALCFARSLASPARDAY